MCYTGLFNEKFAVQQRITTTQHLDAHHAFHRYIMIKEMASALRDECVFICLDDKSIVPIGESGKPVSGKTRLNHKLDMLDDTDTVIFTCESFLFPV